MELTGSLKQFSVSNVFQLLSMEGATGVLLLKHGRARLLITLMEGNILDVEDSDNSKDQRMRVILTKAGIVDEVEFSSALEERRSRLAPLGIVLRDRGLITSNQQQRLARRIFHEILFDALALRDGVYDFERRTEVVPGEFEQPLPMQTLLMNSAQQEDEWPIIRRYVPGLETVFNPAPGSDEESWVKMLNTLDPAERKIAEKIDGVNTVSDIAFRTLSLDYEVAKTMSELAKKGLIARKVRSEKREADTKVRRFLSPKVGPVALIPLTLSFAAIFSLFVWRNYFVPAMAAPESTLSPVLHGGLSGDTVDKLRLQRIKLAFQLYINRYGEPPSSLQTLAAEAYCHRSDLVSVRGGPFILKVLGNQEETAIILRSDSAGRPNPKLSVVISLK